MRNQVLHALRHYRDNRAELDSIQMKLQEEEVLDAVQSATKFPYSKHTVYVQGIPENATTIQLRIRARELRRNIRVAEQFADSLPKYQLREAVKIYYMRDIPERYTWENVAGLVCYLGSGEALRQVIIREAKKRTLRTDNTF